MSQNDLDGALNSVAGSESSDRTLNRREFLIMSSAATALASGSSRAGNNADSGIVIRDLRVDNLDCPLGVENLSPRLSWRLESAQRGVKQGAYRIRVSSDKEELERGRGDLWDTGKVSSRQSIGIPYKGSVLASRQQCFWRVEIWGEMSGVSQVSDISRWEMGLLRPEDWTAEWLAVEDAVAKADRQVGLHWIGSTSSKDERSRKFRYRVHLETPGRKLTLLAGGLDRVVGIWVDGKPMPIEPSSKYGFGMRALSEVTAGALSAGDHVIAIEVASKPGPMSVAAALMTAFLRVELENGATIRLASGSAWCTSLTVDSNWFTPEYDDHGWEAASVSKTEQRQPWPPAPAMLLRNEFDIPRPVVRARLYATALGAYEARLNGARVSDELLTPNCTRFNKRVLYRTYDVTQMVRRGPNAIGLIVGDGWFASSLFPLGRYAWQPPPRCALAQLELTFADGSRQTVATGPDWHSSLSPIRSAEIYNGEVYDARLERVGWDRPRFDDATWEHAETTQKPPCHITSHMSPPIRATQVLRAKTITPVASGDYVFDFGQDFAGWCRLRVRGRPGTRVQMRFAQILKPSGEVDLEGLRDARQTDTYILRGDTAEESFEPHFTYHGFRYVQVSGLPNPPTEGTVEGIVLHSDLPITGRLDVDSPLIGQIAANILWTQRSNFMGIPTDCAHRDERLGYLGDAGVFWETAAFNMDVAAFTRFQMRNAADTQDPDGAYPTAAPLPNPNDMPFAGWSDGAVILPWTIWRRYGDVSIIEENFDGMSRYLRLILANNPDHLWRHKRVVFGDWLAVDDTKMMDPTTPEDLISTAYWAHSVSLVAQMAAAIGQLQAEASLRALWSRIRDAFAAAFVKRDGRVGNGSQTSYVLALQYGLVPPELRVSAAARLAADVRGRGGALSTGLLGTQYILDVLADGGYGQLVYDLLLRTEYPSWGYLINQGATTIWETWGGGVWSGFAPPDDRLAQSHSQYALGSIGGFLYRRVAGIDAGKPGFEEVIIRPLLDARVRRGGGIYDSIRGRISTQWKLEEAGRLTLNVSLPANTTGRISIPVRPGDRLTEGGEVISRRGDIELMRRSPSEIVVGVGSGNYQFSILG